MDEVLDVTESFSASLRAIYEGLAPRLTPLPATVPNPCGSCRSCCTASGISTQTVPEVEFQMLRERQGEARTEAFRVFSERRKDESGKFLYEVCPFYDVEASRCGIYEDRPFSCRVFGHYLMTGTRLPDPCVYEGHVQAVEKGAYFRTVPMARELRDLQRRFDTLRPQPRGEIAEVTEDVLRRLRDSLDPNDPTDMAVLAQAEGRNEDALALLDQAVQAHPDDPHIRLSRGNILDALGRGAEAEADYERSLSLDAANPRAWMHLGFCRVERGDSSGARDAFGSAVGLQPEDPTSRGFLGYLTLLAARTMDEVREASDHLQVAVRLDPHNAVFQVRLAESLLLQGRAAEALPHMQAAEQGPAASVVAQLRARFAAILGDG